MRGVFARLPTATALGCLGPLLAVLSAIGAAAAESTVPLEPMQPNLQDKPSLQRGMALYMNYCIGCHSLKFQRYERTADDLGIPHQVALDNLVFTGQAIGGLMRNAMPPASAANWFGAPPPDLTMVDRVRGTAWVYNLLKNFYVDPARPFGVNNRVFPDIGMPHVLVGLQGVPQLKKAGYKPIDLLADDVLDGMEGGEATADGEDSDDENGAPGYRKMRYRIAIDEGTGTLSAKEFDQAAYDIANFLHYVGDPGRERRHEIGIWVLAFLAGLFVLAWALNREYWKDVR